MKIKNIFDIGDAVDFIAIYDVVPITFDTTNAM